MEQQGFFQRNEIISLLRTLHNFFFLDRFLFLKESWIGKICKIERIGDAVMPVCYFNCFEWKQFRLIGSVKVEI